MQTTFDYDSSVKELEDILRKVEDPSIPLGEVDACLLRSKELIEQCRAYLRTAREKLETIDQ